MKNQKMSERYQDQIDSQQANEIELSYQQAIKYGQDMAEIYRQERAKREALEVAYKKLEGALESMSDGFLVVDKRLTVVELNSACADLFELKPDDAIGKPLSMLLVSNDTEALCNQLLGVERTRLIYQLDVLLPVPRAVAIHAAPLPDAGWVLVLHDVTWEERVNNMQEEFINLAAHELRTPLIGIIGFASLLEQDVAEQELSEDTRLFLDKVLKAAERLRDTINDLLDATVSGSQDIEVKPLDLREIVQEVVVLLNKQAIDHSVTITLDLPGEPMTVFGERKMLSAAMGHLIENGIRYNKPDGSLTVTGRISEDTYELVFADTGIGISRKDLEYIFKPFFQVEEHTTRRSVGMGLGLSIVQRTMALHRGTLTATSEPNVGSTFTIILPHFSVQNMDSAKKEWLQIQRNLRSRAKKPEVEEQTQVLINHLKSQLEITQSQSLAYAQDLARLYQLQRAEAQAIKAKEAKIIHTDRLALMGQLAAGVAHDLSNLIGPILGYTQVILRNRDVIEPRMVDIIERIWTTSRRANVLLRQMVNLSGMHPEEYEYIALNNLIREMLLLLEDKIKHADVSLTETYAESIPGIFGSPVQISQVILNILNNAVDAMPAEGTLAVSTSLKQTVENDYVQLQVSDTGAGIAPEHLPHIFETFFTTKEKESGTGLGLSVTKDIIDKHGGQISVESTPGEGTTFTILLPVAENESE
jgi:signal transduction histidine kinase